MLAQLAVTHSSIVFFSIHSAENAVLRKIYKAQQTAHDVMLQYVEAGFMSRLSHETVNLRTTNQSVP